jgi:hypothetical protein
LIPKEKSKRINQNIYDISKRTVNVINKNAWYLSSVLL